MNLPRLLPRFLALAALLLLAACATGPRISTDADPAADFSRYRTWAFHAPLAVEREGYSTPASSTMRAAVRREMEARGYVYDENAPDLLVNLNAYMNQRSDVVSMPEVRYSWYYSYRANAYYAVPYWTERASVYNYTEGTLNIDLVDARERRLVWEGVAVGRMARLKPAERAARIQQTIAEIFAEYPHRAR
ncbi:DUF4136 domain-containing protein [Arenimonas composti]|uniref:DUF4136 domain-containing protein n=1 Tax=Arenimonas composti TR7-09 = DSM 18010 TaxID=1121013 RepID=A0A091BEB7_9GAMM|nr:DUF4136 domain-containing protein [Arenimonas composti]KFN49164.1 hypothetical protein P873_11965 [Arenimonas composti TR7-09 = DSM 18010]